MIGRGPLRFRRHQFNPHGNYSGSPHWHLAAGEYTRESYCDFRALCGYTLAKSKILLLQFDLTRAKKPKKADLCKKCEKAAEKPAVTLIDS